MTQCPDDSITQFPFTLIARNSSTVTPSGNRAASGKSTGNPSFIGYRTPPTSDTNSSPSTRNFECVIGQTTNSNNLKSITNSSALSANTAIKIPSWSSVLFVSFVSFVFNVVVGSGGGDNHQFSKVITASASNPTATGTCPLGRAGEFRNPITASCNCCSANVPVSSNAANAANPHGSFVALSGCVFSTCHRTARPTRSIIPSSPITFAELYAA